MRYVVNVISVLVLLTAVLIGSQAQADTIVQIGDSIANSDTNRTNSNRWLAEKGIFLTWIGDHGAPRPTFARGGMTYQNMYLGRPGEPGLVDIVVDYSAPDALYILGGYNNAVFEADDSDMSGSIAALRDILDLAQADWQDTKIFVSNVTLFLDSGLWAHKQSNVLTLNELIAAEVAARDQVYLVDSYSIITGEDLADDGLHLNRAGQIKIGENFGRTYYLTTIPEPNSMVFALAAALFLGISRSRRR